MNVGLALEIDGAIESMADVVTDLEDKFRQFFQGRDYGSDVANIFIGVILTRPGSEELHPVRDLTFKRHVKLEVPRKDLENVVEYDVKPNYQTFSQLSRPQARRYLARLLIDSLSIIERHKNRYPNFDVSRFREDFRVCMEG